MKVAITGSRKFPSKHVVIDYVDSLPPDTILRHGACKNSPDEWADRAAVRRGLPTPERLPANWTDLSHPDARVKVRWDGTKYDANAGKRRNTEIVTDPTVDEVVGFWDGKSPGTRDALNKAKAAGKPTSWFDTEGVRHPW